ncbi:NAD-dependent epimerase/dehydratase family protein [uncultured Roseobacter sp.]|uniref:NAD-dependent epimerase/dehydratase family protein n=1 Tax=uncultured Roseobacter sp. TaxID=114847 RepID=UPI00262DE250|nr:NAD-dependent epimerase/dehydratase family protein [uncultured Roseobacter sp.]
MEEAVRVFITGATGTIGTAILRKLVADGHDVTALTRSQSARQSVMAAGATPYAGDLRVPEDWARHAVTHEAIIHTATTFDKDMAEVDGRLVAALLEKVKKVRQRPRLLYTGGCWLYGDTSETSADEDHPFNPVPAFAWMVQHARQLLASPDFSTAVIHPALVYHAAGGVLESFMSAATCGQPIEIWGTLDARWPLIHRQDLADVYGALLVRCDLIGHFNAVAEEGVPVQQIADFIAHYSGSEHPHFVVPMDALITRHGAAALGPTLKQGMTAQKLQRLLGWTPKQLDYRASDLFIPRKN